MAKLRDARHRSHRFDRLDIIEPRHHYDIAESNARESAYYAAHMDEPDVDYEKVVTLCSYCSDPLPVDCEHYPYCSQSCSTLADSERD